MDSPPLVSYIIATYNRREDLCDCLESIVEQSYDRQEIIVVSNSDKPEADLFGAGGKFGDVDVKFVHTPTRQGVPEARNSGFEIGSGDIYVTVDDDAVLTTQDVTTHVVNEFLTTPELGAIAFRSKNADSGEVQAYEFPHRDETRPKNYAFETTYFIGVANAIRSEALDRAGQYPEDFEYGFEELDLAFRILDAGYRIRYVPKACVRHKESPAGRYPDKIVIQKRVENRIRVGVRNLPWRFVIVSALTWVLYSLWMGRGDPRPAMRALNNLLHDTDELLEDRSVISRKTLRRVKALDGRLYW
ncbi:glycosyltransferase family 2 protein [Halorubrum ezzemoulense]|uniref:glycosyltransferase family 2 protein n=1 Tax=Halorubrum ezzemoulense TaxID=337243 RepID=UPI00232D2410|nr:glycosyltransferase family 2 protein [Halorubrum ezzemoulense]MDB2283295.1 glycosyltransferase family 2 protein [Halorubrum ezzemoulense]